MDDDKPKILNDYTFIKDIGEGNFGKVKLSKLKATNENFAIKILNKKKLKSQTKTSAYNEIEIISKLNHKNIIHVEKILEDKENYYIIMEYCDKGELFEYIVNKERLDQIESSIFFYQLINGVEYIHKQGFAHRDLKPENLLLTKNKILKIIDFGLCHDFDGKTFLKTKCGSPSYAAPEILKGFPYDGFKTDIWCCGIILYGMLCGYLPFDGDDNQETFQQIVECNPEYPPFLEEDSINLLKGILNPKPKKRLSISQIKKHPFYIKGKNYFLIEGENEIEDEKNEVKNNFGNYNSVEKKKIELSSIKKKEKEVNTFNNIKTLKMQKDKNYKNNIYQNIFTNIEIVEDIDNNKENDLNAKDFEREKYDKTQKRKINEIAILHNNQKTSQKISETEENDQKALLLQKFKDKIKTSKLKLKSNNLFLNNNNDSLTNRFHHKNYHSNPKENNNKFFSLEQNKLNAKSSDKTKYNNIFLRQNDNNTIKTNLKVRKNLDNKELRLNIKNLDFFQKFLMNKKENKNHYENSERSPLKTKGINFNLILTKEKEKNKLKNEDEKRNILSIKKDKLILKDKIIYTQNRKKMDSGIKLTLHSEISLINSPHSNKKNQAKYKFDKFYGSVYGINNNNNNNKEGCRTFSINKRHSKNMKIGKRLNLKIVNLNNKGNSVRKIMRNKYVKSYQNNRKENEEMKEIINNNDLNNREEVFKTEPKYNRFLDKVINKIKYNKDIKNNIHLLTLNNRLKNEEKKQVFKLLNIERNNDDLLRRPYLIKYYKNNLNEEKTNKISPLPSDDNKKYFLSINPKIMDDNKENSKLRTKQIFSLYN